MQDSEIVADLPVAQSLVNALFHLAAWIALGDYAPAPLPSCPSPPPATSVAVGTVVAAVAIGFLLLP